MSDLELTMMRRVGELNKEVAALKAENARLKTEVEHLMVFCNCTLIPNKELQAQVKRLTKAGDWVMSHWSSGDGSDEVRFCQALLKWKNAKEGKGQP
jgi:regulator of replication initiation timing